MRIGNGLVVSEQSRLLSHSGSNAPRDVASASNTAWLEVWHRMHSEICPWICFFIYQNRKSFTSKIIWIICFKSTGNESNEKCTFHYRKIKDSYWKVVIVQVGLGWVKADIGVYDVPYTFNTRHPLKEHFHLIIPYCIAHGVFIHVFFLKTIFQCYSGFWLNGKPPKLKSWYSRVKSMWSENEFWHVNDWSTIKTLILGHQIKNCGSLL